MRMREIKVLFALCCVFFSGVQIASAMSMKLEVLRRVNQYRAQHGRAKLQLNAVLSAEADQHSIDMARNILPVGHAGFERRMQHIHARLPDTTSGAENVAYRYNTAKIVVDGWIHSPGHRRNILGNYTLTGIGIARNSAGDYYYTQLFANQQSDSRVVRHKTTRRRYRWQHGFSFNGLSLH